MNKKELKILVAKSLEEGFTKLKSIVSGDSSLFDNLILAESRYNDLLREINNGVLSPIEKNIEMNKIRGATIYIINQLESLDPVNEHKELEEIVAKINETNLDSEEELGLYELEELSISSSQELAEILKRMAGDIRELGEKVRLDADKLKKLNKSSPNPNRIVVKKILSNTSKIMVNYGNRLAIEIPIFKEVSESSVNYAIQYISKLYELNIKDQKKEIHDFAAAIKELLGSAIESRKGLYELYESIKKTPGLTTDFVKAKKRVMNELDQYFSDYDDYLNKVTQLDKNIKAILLEIDGE